MSNERDFAMLKGERIKYGKYRLVGLPENSGDFRDIDEWQEMETSCLSVNGVGFAAPAFEFSQHNVTITVEQEIPAGSANIVVNRQ